MKHASSQSPLVRRSSRSMRSALAWSLSKARRSSHPWRCMFSIERISDAQGRDDEAEWPTSAVAVVKSRVALHAHLRYGLSVGALNRRVVACHDMQYHRPVCRVVVVAVAVPVRCPDVDFNVAGPFLSVDYYFCVEEVGPCVGVEASGVEHLHAAPVDSFHVGGHPQAVLPYVLHQSLHLSQREKGTFGYGNIPGGSRSDGDVVVVAGRMKRYCVSPGQGGVATFTWRVSRRRVSMPGRACAVCGTDP